MKTYKNLYPQIYDFGNLYTAYRKARKGKRSRAAVASFEFDLEHNLLALQNELRDQTYYPGPYHNFYIYEPKQRLVSAAPFRDRVVHHALCKIIKYFPSIDHQIMRSLLARRIADPQAMWLIDQILKGVAWRLVQQQ